MKYSQLKCYYPVICLTFFLFVSCAKDKHNIIIENDVIKERSEYIIVLGDIQEYTYRIDWLSGYVKTMDWINSQQKMKEGLFKCILQVGDVTNTNAVYQWQNFYFTTTEVADKIPFIVCTGNHDYNWNGGIIYDRSSTMINLYGLFPLTYQNIVAFYEEEKIENIVVFNEIFGERYDILVLEFGPRTEVVEWANEYVSSHPERKFILMTHEFLTKQGERISSGSFAAAQIRNSTWSSPEDVWQKLVKDNDNIVCVLCGHNGFSEQLYSENTAGREVPQILFNLQYQENAGDGLIQLWEFTENSDSVSVKVYNTIKRKFHPDPSTSFKFRYRY